MAGNPRRSHGRWLLKECTSAHAQTTRAPRHEPHAAHHPLLPRRLLHLPAHLRLRHLRQLVAHARASRVHLPPCSHAHVRHPPRVLGGPERPALGGVRHELLLRARPRHPLPAPPPRQDRRRRARDESVWDSIRCGGRGRARALLGVRAGHLQCPHGRGVLKVRGLCGATARHGRPRGRVGSPSARQLSLAPASARFGRRLPAPETSLV
mmetsp:Transcript_24810/g.83199  ORF Transcript_24810/g.83199 Transcript_24810/m.83199 type:complete len:209 (-) Transcript_24810:53-679(-)